MSSTRRGLSRVARRVLAAACLGDLEASVSFIDDEAMRRLNRAWRSKDVTTDVLSFAAQEGGALLGAEAFLGDIVISTDTAGAQAVAQGHSLDDEVAVLVAHGLLHLLGFDHERGAAEARMQAELEMTLLAAAGFDPTLALLGRAL